jgi:Flp pilus assembly pilin Flp
MVIPLVEIASILCSNNQSNPKGAAHARSGNSFRGGVSRRFTRRPKGQSIIEYILVVAIIVLVILIAGPWVSSAIRNQFNTVAGAIGSGTTGENFHEPQDIPDPENGTAFAVYSEDDHSLMFYKRRGVPKVGDMFNSRRVTEVYTGFESASYTTSGYVPELDNWMTMTADTPWFDVRNKVLSVKAVDPGISPNSLSYYFYRFENVITIDLSNFSFQSLTSFEWALSCDYRLETVKLPSFTQRCKRFNDSVVSCHALTVLDIAPSDFSGASTFFHMFMSCRSLKFDCTDWNVPVNAERSGFNLDASGIKAPRVWQ